MGGTIRIVSRIILQCLQRDLAFEGVLLHGTNCQRKGRLKLHSRGVVGGGGRLLQEAQRGEFIRRKKKDTNNVTEILIFLDKTVRICFTKYLYMLLHKILL